MLETAVVDRMVAQAFAGGQTAQEIRALVNASIERAELLDTQEVSGLSPLPPTNGEVVYDQLPDGLIEMPRAAELYGVSPSTLRSWAHRGRLAVRGRLKASARGGGYLVFDKAEVAAMVANPLPNGRPKKRNTC